MDSLSYKTVFANSKTIEKQWFVVDANEKTLGRIASQIAYILRGKNKPSFTPHEDCGDNIIVINAEKVSLRGNKEEDKDYITHSGFPGGQKIVSAKNMRAKHPTRMVEEAVRGMLPKTKLGRKQFKNLYVYSGSEHPHTAQKPKEIKLA